MKSTLGILLALALPALAPDLSAADAPVPALEYATLRWAGRDNTHLIRPGGRVEFLGPQFVHVRKPERVDERSFYMNIALNGLAKEGYELVAMTADDYLLKRLIKP